MAVNAHKLWEDLYLLRAAFLPPRAKKFFEFARALLDKSTEKFTAMKLPDGFSPNFLLYTVRYLHD